MTRRQRGLTIETKIYVCLDGSVRLFLMIMKGGEMTLTSRPAKERGPQELSLHPTLQKGPLTQKRSHTKPSEAASIRKMTPEMKCDLDK